MTSCAPPWGEIAYTPEGMSDEARAALARVGVGPEEMDDLFVRHTYLSAVIGMVVQASFGIDIRRLAESDPGDLLLGRELYRATGLHGVLESDFFAWPNEVGAILYFKSWRAAWRGSTGQPPHQTPPQPCTRRLSRRMNGGNWGSTTPPLGWSEPWYESSWTTR